MAVKDIIYLDYNSTTPTDPAVVDEMLPFFYDNPGNAASRSHAFGWVAEEAVQNARQSVADLIHADPREVIFTSGATESNNLALKGIFSTYRRKGQHIITLKTEHKAVLDACYAIEKMGGEVTYLDVDSEGLVDTETLAQAIREDTILVSVMWANNETGVIQPMREIGAICEQNGVLLMSDATQAVGKLPVDPRDLGIHLMSFSAHKMYGPKGIGALYVSRRQPRVKISAQIHGGGHEQDMRSGTLNVPAIVGFGAAARMAIDSQSQEADRLQKLRYVLEKSLMNDVEECYRNGSQDQRLPHVSNLSFKYVDGEQLMMAINQAVAVSSGSACTSASLDPSHVLTAMGRSDDMAHASVRFSLGRYTQQEDIEKTIPIVREAVARLRAESPIWEMYKDGVDLSAMGW